MSGRINNRSKYNGNKIIIIKLASLATPIIHPLSIRKFIQPAPLLSLICYPVLNPNDLISCPSSSNGLLFAVLGILGVAEGLDLLSSQWKFHTLLHPSWIADLEQSKRHFRKEYCFLWIEECLKVLSILGWSFWRDSTKLLPRHQKWTRYNLDGFACFFHFRYRIVDYWFRWWFQDIWGWLFWVEVKKCLVFRRFQEIHNLKAKCRHNWGMIQALVCSYSSFSW